MDVGCGRRKRLCVTVEKYKMLPKRLQPCDASAMPVVTHTELNTWPSISLQTQRDGVGLLNHPALCPAAGHLQPTRTWSHLTGHTVPAVATVMLLLESLVCHHSLLLPSPLQRQLLSPASPLPASHRAMNSCSCALANAGTSHAAQCDARLKACSSSQGH